jgi:hypothetical protein
MRHRRASGSSIVHAHPSCVLLRACLTPSHARSTDSFVSGAYLHHCVPSPELQRQRRVSLLAAQLVRRLLTTRDNDGQAHRVIWLVVSSSAVPLRASPSSAATFSARCVPPVVRLVLPPPRPRQAVEQASAVSSRRQPPTTCRRSASPPPVRPRRRPRCRSWPRPLTPAMARWTPRPEHLHRPSRSSHRAPGIMTALPSACPTSTARCRRWGRASRLRRVNRGDSRMGSRR